MPCIGQQRQRVGYQSADNFGHHVPGGQHQRKSKPPLVLATVMAVTMMVVVMCVPGRHCRKKLVDKAQIVAGFRSCSKLWH
jgi:hypothetical protein